MEEVGVFSSFRPERYYIEYQPMFIKKTEISVSYIEQEETEVHHPGEYAKVDGESNEAGDETSEIQQNFPQADSKEDKNPPGYINDGQANPSVHGAEGKDYKGKENGFTSDDLNGVVDLHVLDQIPDETGK